MLSILFVVESALAQTPAFYDCQVILVAADAPDGGVGEVHFTVPGSLTVNHGGPEKTFNFGPNEITVQAHARWRGVTWRRGQKIVVSSVTASEKDLIGSVAIQAPNPENTEESVSLECSPKP